jgi:hypothetical protein
MHRGRFIFAAALALMTANAQAVTLVDSDFTLQDPARAPIQWQTNGTAGLDLNPTGSGPAVSLALTHNQGNEYATAWTLFKGRVPSFTMWADVNIDFNREFPANCPADGFAMLFADVSADYVSSTGGGTGLGVFGNEELASRVTAFEINTWQGNALEDAGGCTTNKFVTFAFDNISDGANRGGGSGDSNGTPEEGGPKVGQTTAPAGLQIINGGWYRYQWNVDTTTRKMEAYITGLDASNSTVQNQKLVEVTFGADAPNLSFTGRWGVSAGTGGAVQGTRVSRIRIDAPMVAAGAPPAATPPPAAGN